MKKIGIVFLTGAGFDGSIWDDVVKTLKAPYVVVNYPERHNEKAVNLAFDDYVESALSQIEALKTDKIVLAGHSLGGVVMMRLGELLGDRLVGIVAIAAAIPTPGGSFLSCLPQPKRTIMWLVLKLAGTQVPPSAIRSSLCTDLTEEQTERIINSFTTESRALYTSKVSYAPKSLPSLYIVTTKDPEFSVEWQRMMAVRLGANKLEVRAGHVPMLSKSEDVSAAIEKYLKNI